MENAGEAPNVKKLIAENKHEQIYGLPDEAVPREYKAIAAIHLGKYREALAYAEKSTFECAYIHYKLKNFKKALRILRGLKKDKKSSILASQCLYNLGYYSMAAHTLSLVGSSDEHAVNIAAMESLAKLNSKSKFTPNKFATRHTGDLLGEAVATFNDPECHLEYEFNRALECLDDEHRYIIRLEDLKKSFPIKNSCIDKQYRLLSYGEFEKGDLDAKEERILQFNEGKENALVNPAHFQANFDRKMKTEYEVFRRWAESKGSLSYKDIEPYSAKLCLLKAFACFNSRIRAEKKMVKIEKILHRCEDCWQKKVLMVLISDLKLKDVQERAIKLLTMRK